MSYNNCYQMQYKTYEMEPFSNISRVQYISSPNIFDNHMSLPFQSDFTKQQLKNYNQIDLSTSLSSSDKYLSNDDIVRNKNCNCDCHKKIICQCDCNNLLNQVNDLKNTNLQLTSDYIRNKNKNHYADNYIKQLEKEKEMFKNNFNNDVDKLKLDNGKLIDMLDKTFTNILLPLSKNINIPEGKLKGGVDYYSKRKLEFDNMINEQKDFLDNILKNNTFSDNMKNKSLDNSLNKNPFLNSSNLDDMKNSNNLYPNNYNIMRPYQTYEMDKNKLPDKYPYKDNYQIDNKITPINEYKNNIYSPKNKIDYPNNNLSNSNIPYDKFNNSMRNSQPSGFNNTIKSNYQDPLSNTIQSGKDYKPDNLSGSINSQNQRLSPNYDSKINTLNSFNDELNQSNKKIPHDKSLNKDSKRKVSPTKKPQNKKENQLKGNEGKFIPNYPIGRDNQIPKDNKTNLNQSNELKKRPKSLIKKPSKNVKNVPLYDNKNQIKDSNLNKNISPNSSQNLKKDNQITNNQQLTNKIDPSTGKPYLDDKPYKLSTLSGRDKESPMLSSLSSPYNQTFNSNNKDNQEPSKDYMKYPSNYLDNKNQPNQYNNMNEPYKNKIPNQFNKEPYQSNIPNQLKQPFTNQIPNQFNNDMNDPYKNKIPNQFNKEPYQSNIPYQLNQPFTNQIPNQFNNDMNEPYKNKIPNEYINANLEPKGINNINDPKLKNQEKPDLNLDNTNNLYPYNKTPINQNDTLNQYPNSKLNDPNKFYYNPKNDNINNIDPLNPNKTLLNKPDQYPQNENSTNIPLTNSINPNNNYLNQPNQYPQNQYNSNIPYTNSHPNNNINPNESRQIPKYISSSTPYIQNYLKDNIINNNNLNTPYNEIPERKNHSSSPTQKEIRQLSPSNPYNKLKNNRPRSGSKEKGYNKIQYYPDGTCWACDVGCSVSTTGYSPMTFSPYVNTVKRRDVTPVKYNIRYEQYTRHKKKKQ